MSIDKQNSDQPRANESLIDDVDAPAGKPHQDESDTAAARLSNNDNKQSSASPAKTEVGGPKGLDPTRYGDWERNGRCYDF